MVGLRIFTAMAADRNRSGVLRVSEEVSHRAHNPESWGSTRPATLTTLGRNGFLRSLIKTYNHFDCG
jgi:hypothetical protein